MSYTTFDKNSFEVVETGYIKGNIESTPTLVGQIENILKTNK